MLPAKGAFALPRGVKVLDGVPRVDATRYPCAFAACLVSVLGHLGDTPNYDEIMTVSGAAFRRFWHRGDANAGNPLYLGRELFRRSFRALGRGYDELPGDDPLAVCEALEASLDEGRPAIGYRLDSEECTVLTGYDPGSRVAFGWSSSVGPREGYGVIPGGIQQPDAERGIVVIGGRIGPPEPRESLVGTLDWAIEVARSPRHLAWPDHVAGLAAYDAWVDALGAQVHDGAEHALLDERLRVFRAHVRMLRDRASAAAHLRSAARTVSDVSTELDRAAELFGEVALAGERLSFATAESARKAVADPRRRRQLAATVRMAARKETTAIDLLETALERLDPLPQRTLLPSPARPRAALDRPRAPEDVPTPVVLRAAAELVGDNPSREQPQPGEWLIDPNHVLLMAVTGASFSWEWLPLPGMRPDLPPELYESDPVRLYERTLYAMGLDGEVLIARGKPGLAVDEALTARVARTLSRRKLPVVLFTNGAGIGERFLAAGYDECAASLIGWGTAAGGPSITFDPCRRTTARRWFSATQGVIRVASRGPYPNLDLVFRRALTQAVRLLTRTEIGPYRSGAAMHAAWSDAIVDPALDGDDDMAVRARSELVDPLIWDLAERRWYGSLFLNQAARRFPAAAEQLVAAATELRAVHDLMYDINASAGGRWPGDQLPELGRPEVRRSMATLMVQAAERDVRAAMIIERSLPRAGGDA